MEKKQSLKKEDVVKGLKYDPYPNFDLERRLKRIEYPVSAVYVIDTEVVTQYVTSYGYVVQRNHPQFEEMSLKWESVVEMSEHDAMWAMRDAIKASNARLAEAYFVNKQWLYEGWDKSQMKCIGKDPVSFKDDKERPRPPSAVTPSVVITGSKITDTAGKIVIDPESHRNKDKA